MISQAYALKQQFAQMSSNDELQNLLAQMKKIADKQGVTVVMSNDNLITAYNVCSFSRSKVKFYQ